MKMSETRSRLSGLGKRSHTPRMVIPPPPSGRTSWTRETIVNVRPARRTLRIRPPRPPAMNSPPCDEQASEGGGGHDRQTPQDSLYRGAHRPAVPGQRVTNHRKQRGTGHARPGHREDEADDDDGPQRRDPDDGVPDGREADKAEKGTAAPVVVGDPAAGVLVHSVEEVLRAPVEPDGDHGRAERVERLGSASGDGSPEPRIETVIDAIRHLKQLQIESRCRLDASRLHW